MNTKIPNPITTHPGAAWPVLVTLLLSLSLAACDDTIENTRGVEGNIEADGEPQDSGEMLDGACPPPLFEPTRPFTDEEWSAYWQALRERCEPLSLVECEPCGCEVYRYVVTDFVNECITGGLPLACLQPENYHDPLYCYISDNERWVACEAGAVRPKSEGWTFLAEDGDDIYTEYMIQGREGFTTCDPAIEVDDYGFIMEPDSAD